MLIKFATVITKTMSGAIARSFGWFNKSGLEIYSSLRCISNRFLLVNHIFAEYTYTKIGKFGVRWGSFVKYFLLNFVLGWRKIRQQTVWKVYWLEKHRHDVANKQQKVLMQWCLELGFWCLVCWTNKTNRRAKDFSRFEFIVAYLFSISFSLFIYSHGNWIRVYLQSTLQNEQMLNVWNFRIKSQCKSNEIFSTSWTWTILSNGKREKETRESFKLMGTFCRFLFVWISHILHSTLYLDSDNHNLFIGKCRKGIEKHIPTTKMNIIRKNFS